MTAVLIVVLLLALIATATTAAAHNSLVAARNRCDEAWAGVQAQLQRRHDLVPSLVQAARGDLAHERGVLEALAVARQASDPVEQSRAELVLSERLPQLRASESVGRLQTELARVEDEIAAARRIYNANVRRYQARKQQLPWSLVAGRFGDKPMFFLEDPDHAAVPPIELT